MSGQVRIQYTRCWGCICGMHYDPPQPHPWADADDIEHAAATGQPKPTGDCACDCAGSPGACVTISIDEAPLMIQEIAKGIIEGGEVS